MTSPATPPQTPSATSTTRMPNLFVVGAGPVATALAGALRLGGVPVLGLWARKAESARAAGAVSGVAVFSAGPPDLLLEADAVLLAVRDDAVGPVARMLVATGLITRHHVMLHCSGVVSAEEAFAGVREAIGGVATLHPLRAIPDAEAAMRTMNGTVFGVQGDERGTVVVRALVEALGGQLLELAGEQMAAYHAAAALASNGLAALVDAAAELMTAAGGTRETALAALLPLVRGTVANLEAAGLPDGMTGPIMRGDRETVDRHLAVLGEQGSPDVTEIYRVLARRLVTLARAKGATPNERLAEIEAALVGGAADPASRAS